MMRICMISEHASPLATLGGADGGGQNVYVAHLARQLASLGHTIDIFTRRDGDGQPEIVDWLPGVRVVHVTAGPPEALPKETLLPHMPAFAVRMQRFIAEHGGYDIIHAHFFMSGIVALELKRLLGIPVVMTFHALGEVRRRHQGEADTFPPARIAIERRIAAEADRIVAECPEDEADLIRLCGAEPSRIRMIPCGFDPGEFGPRDRMEARRNLGLPAGPPLILQLGRMVPRKGIDTVISALARIRARGSTAELVIVGGNHPEPDPKRCPELARLKSYAEALGVDDAVTFAGAQPRAMLADYYAASDIFVTTPWYEPFGITPLEAMACARPVIASDVGGLRYTVVDQVTGFRVRPRDPDGLADRLTSLLIDPARAEAMGEAGRERVAERFTWRIVALAMEELYRALLAERSQQGEEVSGPPAFKELADTLARSARLLDSETTEAASLIGDALLDGRKVLVCGNGGSAADAQHFAAEFVGRFRSDLRSAYPVIALCADSSFITAWANDAGFDDVFARGVRAFGNAGDVLVVLSTSGRSPNILAALAEARKRGLATIALLGGNLSPAIALADVSLRVPSTNTPRIQEVHTLLLHMLCEAFEQRALEQAADTSPTLARLEALS